MNYARALLPTLLFSYACLLIATIFYPNDTMHENLVSMQHFFPVLISIMHSLFARATQDTTRRDRLNNVKADLPFLRRACLLVSITSAATLQCLRFRSVNVGWLRDAFVAGTLQPQALPALTADIFNHDHFALYAGVAVWLTLLSRDLKIAGMIKESWILLLLYAAACTVILGPGATLVAGWAWREEVLASKRHWAAVTKDG